MEASPMRRTCLPILVLAALIPQTSTAGERISFSKTVLDTKFRSEGVAAGDFNRDGNLDVAAGSVYYAAPDWKMHVLAEQAKEFDPVGYSDSFSCFADDLDADGWTDLIVVDWPGKQTWWFENPRGAARPWQRHTCIDETNNESPAYVDVDGDGRRDLVCAAKDRYLIARRPENPRDQWIVTTISAPVPQFTDRYYHGLGVGDVDRDGRSDVLIPHGWWKATADKEWPFRPLNFGQTCAHLHVFDVDGDGDNDILASSAHKYGLWWLEQSPQGFTTHEIDKSVSETHSLCLADINSDGLPDLVTGKRFWSHHTAEPGSGDPAVVMWWELSRQDGRPRWTPHIVDNDSGVGTQFEVSDLNGDGLLDIVTANKKGARFFLQHRDAAASSK
jgi:hypothetical protein